MTNLSRKVRRAQAAQHEAYWRVTPMFEEGGALVDGTQTYVMHTEPKDIVIAVLPAGAVSLDFARAKEQELMKLMGTDVIVTSANVRFLKVEPVARSEMAKLFPKQKPVGSPDSVDGA